MKSKFKLVVLFIVGIFCFTLWKMPTLAATYPASPHPYANNQTYTYNYTYEDTMVDYLDITFSSSTMVETNYDKIYIYTSNGTQVGTYTGSQLASQTVRVTGNGFKIILTTDSSQTYYGFSITNVKGYRLTNVNDLSISVDESELVFNGEPQVPNVTIHDGTKTLYAGSDYDVFYSNNVNAGEGTITIEGKGNYVGTATRTFNIDKADASCIEVDSIPDQEYLGSAITPAISAYIEGRKLTSDLYEVSYKNNAAPGTAAALIGGSNFDGLKEVTFKILETPLPESEHNYANGTNKTWTYYYKDSVDFVEMTFDSQTNVESNYDFIYIYTLSDELVGKYTGTSLAGATIRVEGNGFKIQLTSDGYDTRYGFKFDQVVGVKKTDISDSIVSLSTESVIYDGTAKTPEVTVTDGENTLVRDVDYTVTYYNNVDSGIASVVVTGIGKYTGQVTKSFYIKQMDLSYATVIVDEPVYTGSAMTPAVIVEVEGITIPSSDYIVTYANNINVGTAYVTVTATGYNCVGSKTDTFFIKAKIPESPHPYGNYSSYSETYIHHTDADFLKIKFSNDTETENKYDKIIIYTLSGTKVGEYSGTQLAGKTITVKGNGFKIELTSDGYVNYYGFKIDSITAGTYRNMSDCEIKLASTSLTYNTKAQTPKVTVSYDSETLTKGTDYTLTYSNNKNAGTAKVVIKGKGIYSGSVTKTFVIKKLALSKTSVSKIATKTYTGKKITPKVTVKIGGKTINAANYSVKYSNNKMAGTATVTIKAKGKNLSGSVKKTFKILPKISYQKKNLYKGKKFTLKLKGAALSKVKFSSSNKSVCTVTSKGVVKGVKAGTATITAKFGGKSYKCKVTVLNIASTSSDTKYYKNHDDVPDFGALLKISPTSSVRSSSNGDSFVYSISDLQKVDPDKEAGDKYKKLLVKSGFTNKGITKISGKSYYKYVSEKKIVYFGIASKNGEVKIIVKKK